MKFLSSSVSTVLILVLSSAEGNQGQADKDESSNLRPLRQLQEEGPPCPAYPANNIYNLTRAEVQLAYNAQQLNMLVTRGESGGIMGVVKDQKKHPYYERFFGFGDINDQALVAKVASEQTCYGSFMGSEALNPFDIIQNLGDCEKKLEGTDCVVQNKYLDSYTTSYSDDFQREMANCVDSCGDVKCPLVLTGHGTGGAVAVVAAIDLVPYNPTTITFGSPRPLFLSTADPCNQFDATKHFRFVATNSAVFDNVPFKDSGGASTLGWPFFLDGMDFPAYSTGFDNDEDQSPTNRALHSMKLYTKYIDHMYLRNCFPVPMASAWPTGHACNENEECIGEFCMNGVCDNLVEPASLP